MEKTHIMNVASLNNLLLTLSQSGITFYGKSSSIPSEAISRQPYHQPFYKSERHTHMELISRLEGEPAIWINTNSTIYQLAWLSILHPTQISTCMTERKRRLVTSKLRGSSSFIFRDRCPCMRKQL